MLASANIVASAREVSRDRQDPEYSAARRKKRGQRKETPAEGNSGSRSGPPSSPPSSRLIEASLEEELSYEIVRMASLGE